jgi:D-alanine-D-alanine ligase
LGLVYGGRSAEHAISIRSARSVLAALDRERYQVELVAIDRRGRWFSSSAEELEDCGEAFRGNAEREVVPAPGTAPGTCRFLPLGEPGRPAIEVEVVFPVLHGPFGEDGTIQGLLEMVGVPYVGAGVLGSAIGMDKDVQKRLLRDAGVPIVPFEVVLGGDWRAAPESVRQRIAHLGTTVFVKPANLGSSVGINRATTPAEVAAAIEEALRYDRKVLVERAVDAREIECAVLGNDDPQASLPGEIAPGEAFYSYEDKYSAASKARLLVPAPLSEEVVAAIRRLAVHAFRVLELRGMARVDFFLERDSNRLYLNEPNTIPGFTSISMYPKMWEASGLPYRELVSRLIDLALEAGASRRD